MALSKFEKDMAVIQKLDDEPNDVGGLTAAELKAKFDEGGEAVKKYLNDTLTPELEHGFSEKVPSSTTINGHPLTGDVTITKSDIWLGNVDNTSDLDKPVSTAQQKALDTLDKEKADAANVLTKDNHTPYTPTEPDHPATKGYVDETTAGVVMGQLPDSSVTTAKLAGKSVTTDKIADRAVTPEKLDRAYLPLSGGTLTGPLTLHGDPQSPLQAAPKQYVDSVRAITRRLPVAPGYSVKAGDVVDVGKAPVSEKAAVGSRTEGSIVYLNEGGKPVEFYVAKHDYESGLNGAGRTLVVRKDIYDKRQWHNSISSSYATSDIDGWLNDTYKGVLDPEVQNAMGTTKFSYTPGSGNWAVGVLERSVFLLSYTELGFSSAAINVEGSLLPIAGTLQVASYNGNPDEWWSRSPNKQTDGNIWYINKSGKSANNGSIVKYGSRPVFTLPADFEVLVPSDAIVKNIEPQANAERVFDSNTGARAVDLIRLSDKYCIAADIGSAGSDVKCFLLNAETGEKLHEEIPISGSNNTIKGVFLTRLDDSSFVVGYIKENYCYAKIGKVSGGSISFGAETFINGSTTVYGFHIIGLTAGSFLALTSTTLLEAIVCTVNGTSITKLDGVRHTPVVTAAHIFPVSLPDDESGNKRVCVCYSGPADGSARGKAAIITIGVANQVTWGETVTWFESADPGPISACFDGTHVIVACNNVQTLRALNISPALSVAGEPYSVDPVSNENAIIVVDGKPVLLYYDGRTTTPNRGGRARVIHNDAGKLSTGPVFVLNPDAQTKYVSAAALSRGRFLAAYADGGDSNRGTCTILTVSGDQIAGSFLDKSSQAIALQDGNAGDLIDIIYSGTAELPGTAQGTKIESPGVQGFAPVDGLLDVYPWYLPGVKIATGSYVGTGLVGSANPNVLTFDFEPILVVFCGQGMNGARCDGVLVKGNYSRFYTGGGASGSIGFGPLTVSFNGNSVSWYTSETAGNYQANVKGETYHYIAIG